MAYVMPYIRKQPKKKRVYYKRYNYDKEHQMFYRMNRENRELYIRENPLDELDLLEGIITPAEHLHHVYQLSNADSYETKVWLTVNKDNFISLSKKNHIRVHNNYKSLTDKQKEYLSNKYKKVEHDLIAWKYNNSVKD